MPVIVAPSVQAIPDGYATPYNQVLRLAVNTGERIDIHVDSSSRNAGITRTNWDLAIFDQPSFSILLNRQTLITETNVNATWTSDRPRTVDLALLGGGGDHPPFSGQAFGYTAFLTPITGEFCANGVQPQLGTAAAVFITEVFINEILAAVGSPWLFPVFGILVGSYLLVSDLCSNLPPPFPTITLETPNWTVEKITLLFKAIAWPSLCECKPGPPAPIPPPAPNPIQPTGWVLPPAFPCDPANLCASVAQIAEAVAVLNANVSRLLALETLVQRYALPFAYIRGRRFSNLTSSGARDIQRSVGLLIEVTNWPETNVKFLGAPPYISDLGWISVLTGDGMLDEIRLTRQATTWLSKLIPSAVSVGWGLREGVTAEISELLAEP